MYAMMGMPRELQSYRIQSRSCESSSAIRKRRKRTRGLTLLRVTFPHTLALSPCDLWIRPTSVAYERKRGEGDVRCRCRASSLTKSFSHD